MNSPHQQNPFLHRVLAELERAAERRKAETSQALQQAIDAWHSALRPVETGRIRSRHRIDDLQQLTEAWDAGRPSPDPGFQLSPEETTALDELRNTWPLPLPPRRRTWLARTLAASGLIAGGPDTCAVHPLAALTLGRTSPLPNPHATAARTLTLPILAADVVNALPANALQPLHDAHPDACHATTDLPRPLAAALWHAAAHASPPVDPVTAQLPLARLARAHLLDLLRQPHAPAELEPLLEPLREHTGSAPCSLHHARPLPLCAPDADLLRSLLGPAEFLIHEDDILRLVASQGRASEGAEPAIATAISPETTASLQRILAALTLSATPSRLALLLASPKLLSTTPASAHDLLAELVREASRGRPQATTPRRALVEDIAAWGDAPPWSAVLDLAARPDLPAEVAALLTDPALHDFDGPAEGRLPAIWAAALRASQAPAETLERLTRLQHEHGDPDDWDDALVEPIWSLLDRFPSPAAARSLRHQAENSPMSSYAHGLNDGIAEAYGDVHSLADPFSSRRGASAGDDD